MARSMQTRKWAKGLLMASLAVLGISALAPESRAANIVNFDPTGGNGANPNDVLNASSFAYLPGNVLAIGGGVITVGQNIPILYQAILSTINTGASPPGNGNTMSGNANTGNILISPAGGGVIDTGKQIIIQAQFTEQVQSITTSGSGATAKTTVTFIPSLAAGTNLVQLFAQPTAGNASINQSNGQGFGPAGGTGATLILSGSISPTGFVSSFAQNLSSNPTVAGSFIPAGSPGAPASYALNQHAGGSGSYGMDGPPGSTQSITGSGSTTVNVNVSFTNSSYFLTSGITALTLPSVSDGLPFVGVDPLTKMFTNTVPNLVGVGSLPGQPAGTAWNGVNTTDLLFQSQATNNFTVPEPSSIVMASIGVCFAGLASIRSLRRRNRSTVA